MTSLSLRAAAAAAALTLAACQSAEPPKAEPAAPSAAAPVSGPAAPAGLARSRHLDVVTPEPGLQALFAEIRAASGSPVASHALVDRILAPKVRMFTRSLDPVQPWHDLGLRDGDPVRIARSVVAEGEIPGSNPDYVPDLVQAMARAVSSDGPAGTRPELPGAVCAPARYDLDAGAVKHLAETVGDRDGIVGRVNLTVAPTPFRDSPAGPVRFVLDPLTLVISTEDADIDDSWIPVALSDDTRGVVPAALDPVELNQTHFCFGQVGGAWKVTGIYFYGL